MKKSTFSIIGERYLDTQHDDVYIDGLESELQNRGVTGIYRWILEYIAASSLWWNILWWEWCNLDEKDIQIGWVQNVVVFGLASLIALFLCGINVSILVFLGLHISTTWFGFSLRTGTKT